MVGSAEFGQSAAARNDKKKSLAMNSSATKPSKGAAAATTAAATTGNARGRGIKETSSTPSRISPMLRPTKQKLKDENSDSHAKPSSEPEVLSTVDRELNSPENLKACNLEGVSPPESAQCAVAGFMDPVTLDETVAMRPQQCEEEDYENFERVDEEHEISLGKGEFETERKATKMGHGTDGANKHQVPPVSKTSFFSGEHPHSSNASYKSGAAKYSHSFNGALSFDKPLSRCTSPGRTGMYSFARTNCRSTSSAVFSTQERIQEHERRLEEAKRRMMFINEEREQELVLKELAKERHCVDKIVEMHNKKCGDIYSHRQRREMMMQKARERQRRDDEARQARREELLNRSLERQNGISKQSPQRASRPFLV